jgi:hypothetical protein
MNQTEPIRVNKILGKQPGIGFLPAAQILPVSFLIIVSYLLTNFFTDLGMEAFFAVSVWLVASWLVLTFNKPHLFIDQFAVLPMTEWVTGYLVATPILEGRRQKAEGRREEVGVNKEEGRNVFGFIL